MDNGNYRIRFDNGIKYIYLDLPNNLTTYIKNNNINSTIELEKLINLLKNELKNLSNKNINITKLYELFKRYHVKCNRYNQSKSVQSLKV